MSSKKYGHAMPLDIAWPSSLDPPGVAKQGGEPRLPCGDTRHRFVRFHSDAVCTRISTGGYFEALPRRGRTLHRDLSVCSLSVNAAQQHLQFLSLLSACQDKQRQPWLVNPRPFWVSPNAHIWMGHGEFFPNFGRPSATLRLIRTVGCSRSRVTSLRQSTGTSIAEVSSSVSKGDGPAAS